MTAYYLIWGGTVFVLIRLTVYLGSYIIGHPWPDCLPDSAHGGNRTLDLCFCIALPSELRALPRRDCAIVLRIPAQAHSGLAAVRRYESRSILRVAYYLMMDSTSSCVGIRAVECGLNAVSIRQGGASAPMSFSSRSNTASSSSWRKAWTAGSVDLTWIAILIISLLLMKSRALRCRRAVRDPIRDCTVRRSSPHTNALLRTDE